MAYLRKEEQAAISLQTPAFWMLWVEWCGPSGDSCSWDALLASLCSVRFAYCLSTSLGTLATSSDLCPSQPFALSQHPTPTLFVTCQHPTGVVLSKMARHGLDQSLSFPSLGFHIHHIPWVSQLCFLVIPLALSLFNVWSLQNALLSHTTLWGKCFSHMGNGKWELREERWPSLWFCGSYISEASLLSSPRCSPACPSLPGSSGSQAPCDGDTSL